MASPSSLSSPDGRTNGTRAGNVRVLAEALSMRDAIAQLNHGYSQPIANLVDAIEWKDAYTLGHVRRVATFALMMGKELGLSTLELRSLALGAQMHDVGKIGVPDRILTKPAALTTEEAEVIREHVTRGYEIATSVLALSSVTDAIRFHHERYDGSGYPIGLEGESIPLHARIVAVADAFDAMTSGRSLPAGDHDGGGERGAAALRRHALRPALRRGVPPRLRQARGRACAGAFTRRGVAGRLQTLRIQPSAYGGCVRSA